MDKNGAAERQRIIDSCVLVHDLLNSLDIPHIFMGGLQLVTLGAPRMSRDVDLEVCVDGGRKMYHAIMHKFKAHQDICVHAGAHERNVRGLWRGAIGLDILIRDITVGNENDIVEQIIQDSNGNIHILPFMGLTALLEEKIRCIGLRSKWSDTHDVNFLLTREPYKKDELMDAGLQVLKACYSVPCKVYEQICRRFPDPANPVLLLFAVRQSREEELNQRSHYKFAMYNRGKYSWDTSSDSETIRSSSSSIYSDETIESFKTTFSVRSTNSLRLNKMMFAKNRTSSSSKASSVSSDPYLVSSASNKRSRSRSSIRTVASDEEQRMLRNRRLGQENVNPTKPLFWDATLDNDAATLDSGTISGASLRTRHGNESTDSLSSISSVNTGISGFSELSASSNTSTPTRRSGYSFDSIPSPLSPTSQHTIHHEPSVLSFQSDYSAKSNDSYSTSWSFDSPHSEISGSTLVEDKDMELRRCRLEKLPLYYPIPQSNSPEYDCSGHWPVYLVPQKLPKNHNGF